MFQRLVLTKLADIIMAGKPDGYCLVLRRDKRKYVKVYLKGGYRYYAVHSSPNGKWWNYRVLNIDTGVKYGGRYPYNWLTWKITKKGTMCHG